MPWRLRVAPIVTSFSGALLVFILGFALPTALRPLGVVAASVLLVVGIATGCRISLLVEDNRVVVQNWLFRKIIPSGDFVRAEVRRPWRLWQTWDSGAPAVAIVRKRGRPVIIDASVDQVDAVMVLLGKHSAGQPATDVHA